MTDWLTYGLGDFLLFSERTFLRLFELHNARYWPLQIVTLAAGATALALTVGLRPKAGRVAAVVLAAAWICVAVTFFWQSFATINWSAPNIAPLFLVQAVLLAGLGLRGDRLTPPTRIDAGIVTGGALAIGALAGYPLLAAVTGRTLIGADVFGLTPDATVVVTLGFLVAARAGPALWLLFPIPLAWGTFSLAMHLAMGRWEGSIPIAAAVVAVTARLLFRRT